MHATTLSTRELRQSLDARELTNDDQNCSCNSNCCCSWLDETSRTALNENVPDKNWKAQNRKLQPEETQSSLAESENSVS